jgi:hypothetical protein
MDAFPDYTRWDRTKKVLSVIQIIEEAEENGNSVRYATDANPNGIELVYEGNTLKEGDQEFTKYPLAD